MTNEEIRRYRMLVRVREFGAAYRDLFPARSVAGKLFADVAAATDALQEHDAQELAGRGGQQNGSAAKVSARAELRRQVRAIAQTAAAAEAPGLGGKFRPSLEARDERLLSQARTFLREAKPFVDTFVAHELPSNFLSQLRAAIGAFEQAAGERRSSRDQRVQARACIEATMKAALRAVRRLNGIVPNKLEDPAAITLWSGARRVEYGRVKAHDAAVQAETQRSSSAQPDVAKPAA